MSQFKTTTANLTPPIRSIAGEASSLIPSKYIVPSLSAKDNAQSSDQKLRERSASSSSFSSASSSIDSLASGLVNPYNVDDVSSDDGTDHYSAQLEERLHTLRRLMPGVSLSSLDDTPITTLTIAECQICLEEKSLRPLSCCSSPVCPTCLHSHLSSHIVEARIRVSCPSCPHIFTREEILSLLLKHEPNGEIADRYKRFYADINREPNIKTCPQCCAIKEVDKKLVEGIRWKKTIPRRVTCDECQYHWCFYCHAPWHDKMSCKEYREGERMLRAWAAETNQNQPNAQQCPRCKVFISRNGGCPHMICSKCHCDFCYNCGKRRFGFKFLGSHESRFSPFGCKYNLYPDKPILRHTVRGLVAGAATLAAPVAAVGAVALLAVGTTIGAPTYGTYLLVKHIRKKRLARRLRGQSVTSTNTNEDFPAITEDDDYDLAIVASIETNREEETRRELAKANVYDSDDSFDDRS